MNWDAISAVSETIASVAVVISLIYLSLQIRQSNKLSQSQTRTELRHMATTEVFKFVDYPEILQSFYKDNLTENDRIRLHNFLISAMRFREFIWRQHELGLLDYNTFSNYMRAVVQILGSERNKRWWNSYKVTTYDPMFITFVDQMLEETPVADMRKYLDIL